MKKTKILALIMAIITVAFTLFACSDAQTGEEPSTDAVVSDTAETVPDDDPTVINVSLLKGPTGMGGAYMWTQSDNGETQNKYSFTLDTDATTVGPKLLTGEYDIAAIPTNLAANLYAKSQGKIKVIAVNTLGVLYLVAKDNAVASVSDLAGKTILASGQGTIAEYALNYVLEKSNLTVGTDVTIEFTTEHSETVTKALAGGYDVVLLPEPFVTQLCSKDSSFAVAVDLTEQWEALGDATLAMGCIAVNTQFYESNTAAVAQFLNDYAESVAYVNENPAEASELIEQHDIMAAAVAEKAIPNCNIVCEVGEEMKTKLVACYGVLLEQNANIIGGAMPGDDFYASTAG